MRFLSLVLLCLMACSLTACANKAQQRRQQYERATADLQNSVTDLNQRLTTLEQSLATVNTELSVLKSHPYPVKTTKGSKTNYIASAPNLLAPQPLPASPPPPRAAMNAPTPPPLMTPMPAVPPAQPQGGGWLTSFADPPPPPPSRGTGAKAVPAATVQGPRPLITQETPQTAPVVSSKRPSGVNELSLPPETPVPAAHTAVTPPPPAAPQAASAPAPRNGGQSPAPAAAPAQGEDALYNKALGEFNASRYSQAAAGFTELMHTYPTGRYAPNAGYWLGEALYGQNQYGDALAQFKEVTSRFPQHHKAPDALLKAGLCYTRLGDRENATLQFRALVTDYPASPAANLARQRGYVR